MENLQNIRGLLLASVSWFKRENIEDTMDYMPPDGDIIIASYPKTGTNWLLYIVLQIISKGEMFPSFDDVLHRIGPFMEMTGVKALEEAQDRKTCTHHYPYNLVKKNEKAKTIYIYRNPADTLVSYYYFLQEILQKAMDFEKYFESFLTGNISYGSYFDNVLSYYAHRDDNNLLMVSYEKLSRNRKTEILRIAKFLGEEYFESLSNDDPLLESIIEKTSFEYMKKNLTMTLTNLGSENPKSVNYFRKGVVGDGKSLLSETHLQRLHEKMIEKMYGTEIASEWNNH